MKSLSIFAFTIFFSGLLVAQGPALVAPKATISAPKPVPPTSAAHSPAPISNTAAIAARQQKLEKFWKLYEQAYGLGASSLKGYKLKSPPAEAEKLNDPKVQEKALTEIGRAFSAKANEFFSDAELDYLMQLYASPISKKVSQLESQFWRSGVTSPIISNAIESTETKPAAPKK